MDEKEDTKEWSELKLIIEPRGLRPMKRREEKEKNRHAGRTSFEDRPKSLKSTKLKFNNGGRTERQVQ